MDMTWLGQIGFALPLGLGAIGSALGIGAAGRAAAGAWAKEAREGKQMNFLYVALTGMPLSQTIYGFVLMLALLKGKVYDPAYMSANAGAIFSIGLACGLGELFSAWMQGAIGAAGVALSRHIAEDMPPSSAWSTPISLTLGAHREF